MAGAGQPQGKALSGEEEIVQSLLEGINTVAYPKALVKRKAPKVSRAAAAEAMAAAGVSGKEGGAPPPVPLLEEKVHLHRVFHVPLEGCRIFTMFASNYARKSLDNARV